MWYCLCGKVGVTSEATSVLAIREADETRFTPAGAPRVTDLEERDQPASIEGS